MEDQMTPIPYSIDTEQLRFDSFSPYTYSKLSYAYVPEGVWAAKTEDDVFIKFIYPISEDEVDRHIDDLGIDLRAGRESGKITSVTIHNFDLNKHKVINDIESNEGSEMSIFQSALHTESRSGIRNHKIIEDILKRSITQV